MGRYLLHGKDAPFFRCEKHGSVDEDMPHSTCDYIVQHFVRIGKIGQDTLEQSNIYFLLVQAKLQDKRIKILAGSRF